MSPDLDGVVGGDPSESPSTAIAALRTFGQGLEDERETACVELWADMLVVMNTKGMVGLEAFVADDFESLDHRSASYPPLDKDLFVQVSRDHQEQVPDVVMYPSAIHATAPHGMVLAVEQRGEFIDGVAHAEWTILGLGLVSGGRFTHHEYFERSQTDTARARLVELAPEGGAG